VLEPDLVDHAVRLLGTAIGMIMEDHVDEAISQSSSDDAVVFERLERAGRDITLLANAAVVLLHRKDTK